MSKTKTFVFISILAVLLGVALATLCVSSQSAEASTIYDYEEFYKRYYTDLGINDNLLLNSDFSKNSNGKLKYSGADYAVDSWKGIGSGSQMSISSSFSAFSNTLINPKIPLLNRKSFSLIVISSIFYFYLLSLYNFK